MIIDTIFSSILVTDILTGLDNKTIEDYCIDKIGKTSLPVKQSNHLDMNSNELKYLTSAVEERMNTIHKAVGMNGKIKLIECWSTYNSVRSTEQPHTHPGFFYSAVYYVKAQEDSAKLVLMNPLSVLQNLIPPPLVNTYNGFNSVSNYVKPKTGMLIIFPSWLSHYVEPKAEDDRVCIAFNGLLCV